MPQLVNIKNEVNVDIKQMHVRDVNHFASATLHAVERYFELPGVQERYEEWKNEYQKRKREVG